MLNWGFHALIYNQDLNIYQNIIHFKIKLGPGALNATELITNAFISAIYDAIYDV